MPITFTTLLLQAEGKNATGIRVPVESMRALDGGKRPKVRVMLNSYTYRSTIAAYQDEVYMLPVSAEHRSAAGVRAGELVQITLELDTEPRTVTLPDDLAAALAASGNADAFAALSYSARKAQVQQIENAKTAETRLRRVNALITKLEG